MGDKTPIGNSMLNGRPALIVEDEFLIALDIQRMLEIHGVGQVLFARNSEEARQLQSHWNEIALAIIELRYDDPNSGELPKDLALAGIPVIVTTSNFGAVRIAGSVPIVTKPMSEDDMANALKKALAEDSRMSDWTS